MKIYQDNLEKYKKEIIELEGATKRLSLWRGISFVISITIIIFLANERLLLPLIIFISLSVVVFALILTRYSKRMNEMKNCKLLKEINEHELLKQENKLSAFPTQQASLSEDHPYAGDLDVFGSHSLFQLLDRTTTESGSLRLAQWLLEPEHKELIIERQQAIQELKPNLEWRQQFQAAGLSFKNEKSEYQKLLNWFETGEQLLPLKSKYLIGNIVLALLSTALTTLYVDQSFSDGWNLYFFVMLLVLFVNYLILKRVAPVADEIIDHTHRNVKTLGGYQLLAYTILSGSFQSKKLLELQSDLNKNETSATDEIRRLRKILEVFQLRGTKRSDNNKFYAVFNLFWLFDIYWIIQAERWKHRNREHIQLWIRAVSEFEVLNSLAGFAHSNPDFAFPEIKDEPYRIQFETLGHPLIKSDGRICNDFSLQGRGQIDMITGSNMAGKSTFLRAVGVNLILALMGGPCCAKSAQVSQMKMFTSMRTRDNLEEGISSFYAELKRVEQLLKLINSGQPIFFMLDELFKGTNSADRYKGGVSLIKQLSELNAFGIVSTHDLELARLAGNHMLVLNHSFNSQIHQGEMSFDYKLTEGICTDFNATELMKRSGIKVLNDAENIQ
ncbi:MAG: DNA mismatch repair protein MutS [Cyclobacteriaceae bacterium]